jgi:hypothetical protein
MPTTRTKRRRTKSKYRLLPPLPPDEYEALKANIALNGIVVPVVTDEDGNILDGFARKQIADELDYECPTVVEPGLTEEEKRLLVRALNLARRQLNQAERRQLIADQLHETTHRSNKWIAKRLGTTHQTVKAVREDLVAGGKIYPLEKVEGEDGKWYPTGGGHGRPFFLGCNTPNPKQSDISTPPGICKFLFDLIWPKYQPRVILDPCAGSGNLTRPWRGKARTVSFEIKRGKDFFVRAKPLDDVGLVLCNPPFNGNPDSKELFPSRFLYHILELVPHDTPIVFFAPFGFLLNARSSTQIYARRTNRYAWLRDDCPPITSIIPLPQDAFVPPGEEGPLVHSQILIFNMHGLEPCSFVPDEYLT